MGIDISTAYQSGLFVETENARNCMTAAGSWDNYLYSYSVPNACVLCKLPSHDDGVSSLQLDQSGTRLVTGMCVVCVCQCVMPLRRRMGCDSESVVGVEERRHQCYAGSRIVRPRGTNSYSLRCDPVSHTYT
jgi:hypothetical protein